MMEELQIENILMSDEVDNLFTDLEDDSTEQNIESDKQEDSNKENKQTETTEVNVNTLFTEKPEGVSSEKENIEDGEDSTSNNKDSSPKSNFYSSIAKALKEDGIFPDLDDSVLGTIKSPEDFASIVDAQIKSRLDETQKRISEALDAGVEPTEVKKYEDAIIYLDRIDDTTISAETDAGEKLRQQLIYQDFINRGYSDERAKREVQKSINAGTDIEDAKEALTSNKDYFKSQYKELITQAKEEESQYEEERKQQAINLQKSLLENKEVFGDLKLDKTVRQKAFDNISKPIYKDPKTGEVYTAIQKYEKENKVEFLKNIGIIYTLTDGFTNFNGLIKDKVNKEVTKGLRELEHTLNNTARNSDGNLKFVTGVSDDVEAMITKDWDLDLN
jgi:hypothetical protein